MKRLLLYTFLFFIAQPLFATSIVVLITQDYVILGADSKRMIIDAEKKTTFNQTVCKIRSVNKYCYAFAGFVASPNTSFTADSIVHSILDNSKNDKEAIAQIKAAVAKALQKEIRFQQKNKPATFQKTVLSKSHLLEVVILSIRNNAPVVQIVGFELSNEHKIKVSDYTASCPGDCPINNVQFYFLGSYSGMEKYLDNQSDYKDPVALVEQLIKAQSKVTPTSVGAPVNIVKYTTSGLEWVK